MQAGGRLRETSRRHYSPLLTDGEAAKGYVLACQSRIIGDVSLKIPEEALERKLKIAGMGQAETDRLKGLVTDIDPMLKQIPLTLEPRHA
jgi:uncharacterized 2Fe-2S/4Fe-4S cluster protein (DUF4445 family)